jgi:phage/plasmid-like protein (TIGR03299 family)
MPAAVETAVYANTAAWHGLGTVLDTDGDLGLDIQTALRESGLDWTVRKVPDFAPADYEQVGGKWVPKHGADLVRVPDRFLVQRESDKRYLGSVGATWQPTQNVEGFKLIDDLIREAGGEPFIESAMSLDGGKKVVVMVHMPNALQIAGEDYASYLSFVNGHDGRTSVTAICHDERIVCANTLAIGLGEAKNSGRIIRVRHTTKAADRIKEGKEILKIRDTRLEELARQGEWLVEQSISDAEFEGFLESLIPTDQPEGTPGHTLVTKNRNRIGAIYESAQNLNTIRGTRWGALQAVIEDADHAREFKNDESAVKNQLGLVGTGTAIKDRAFQLLQSKKLQLA